MTSDDIQSIVKAFASVTELAQSNARALDAVARNLSGLESVVMALVAALAEQGSVDARSLAGSFNEVIEQLIKNETEIPMSVLNVRATLMKAANVREQQI